MNALKRTLSAAVLSAAVMVPAVSQAMDFDYHWNFARLKFLSLGLKPEFANRWAASSQMIDESPFTTPMFLERQRRLFHFPQELIAEQLPLPTLQEAKAFEMMVAKAAGQELGPEVEGASMSMADLGQRDAVHGQQLGVLGGVVRDNPFAYNLALFTMLRGQEIAVGSGFHVHADSFGHRNFPASIGHASAGHGPDRPAWHWENYKLAMRAQIELMVKIRNLIPAEMLDPKFKLPGMAKPSVESSADEIYTALVDNKDVQTLMAEDVLRGPEYTKFVVTSVLQSLHRIGAIANLAALQPILGNEEFYARGKDSYELLTELIVQQLKLSPEERAQTFNLAKVRSLILASATLGSSIDQIIAGNQAIFHDEALHEMAEGIASSLLDTQVPRELTNDRNFLIEKQNHFRELEMSTRLENMQLLSERLTGTRSYFTMKKPEAVMRELIDQLLVEQGPELALERLRTSTVVGFSRMERLQWSANMIRYWLVDLALNLRLQNGFRSGGRWYNPLNWAKATDGAHMKANPLTIALMNNDAFEKALREGQLKKFVTPEQAAKIESRWQARQVKLQSIVTAEFRKRGHSVEDYDISKRDAYIATTQARARASAVRVCRDIFAR